MALPNIFTAKCYKNEKFMNSEGARNIRILCECTETQQRFSEEGVTATILFFGSARAKSSADHAVAVADVEAKLAAATAGNDQKAVDQHTARLTTLNKMKWMCEYYDKITQLSKRVSEWSVSGVKLGKSHQCVGVSRNKPTEENITSAALESEDNDECGADKDFRTIKQAIVVATGGGPGFMQAASQGASEVPGARNVGLGISLPFEQGLNPYVTPELAFEYHYFFTRKLWMMFYCQALVVAPGGLGTLDELMEVLTLRQTGKVTKDLPVVLIGKAFWETVINWKALADFAVLNEADINDIFITDDVEAALGFLTDKLTFQAPDTKMANSRSMHSFLAK